MRRIFTTLLALVAILPVLAMRHFTWGVAAGSGIDVTSHDMSTINIDAFFGYKGRAIDVAGIGTGIDVNISNSGRFFPVYAIFRTSFRSKPSICFFDLRAGVAFNNMPNNHNQTTPYINPGVGFNLARSDKFRSYLLIGYVWNGLKSFDDTEINHGISYFSAGIGISF